MKDFTILHFLDSSIIYQIDFRFARFQILSSTALGFSLKKNRVKDIIAFVVTLRKSSCTFRTDVEDRGLEHDRSHIFISQFPTPSTSMCFLSPPACSMCLIAHPSLSYRDLSVPDRHDLIDHVKNYSLSSFARAHRFGKTEFVARRSQGVGERRGIRTHCGSSCH